MVENYSYSVMHAELYLYFVPDSIIVCMIIKQGILQMTWHTIDHVQPCMTPTQRTKRRGCILTDSILAALLHLHVHSIIHSLAMLISRTNPIFEGKHAAGSARDSLCSLCNATLHCTLVSALSMRLARPQALVVVCFTVSPKHWRFQARASPGIARGQNSGQFVIIAYGNS